MTLEIGDAPAPRLKPMTPPRALIVDDDSGFLLGLAELVKREGFAVTSASTLEQARGEIAANPPDIVLVDLHLPDGSGLDLLDGFEATEAPEVVLITGNASVETAVDALRRGAADYLTKPEGIQDRLTRGRPVGKPLSSGPSFRPLALSGHGRNHADVPCEFICHDGPRHGPRGPSWGGAFRVGDGRRRPEDPRVVLSASLVRDARRNTAGASSITRQVAKKKLAVTAPYTRARALDSQLSRHLR